MALVAGVGVGLFVLLLFAGLLLLTCILASAHKRGPVIIIVATIAYLILLIVLLVSPRESTSPAVGVELTDPRMSNLIFLMTVLGLTGCASVVGLCTLQLMRPVTAKPL